MQVDDVAPVMMDEANPDSIVDIAIIGGGMVGASLALLLARQNSDWKIAVIEAFPFAGKPQKTQQSSETETPSPNDPLTYQSSFDARSTAISEGSAEILEHAGLWSAIAQHVTAIDQVHVSDRGHFGGALIDSRDYRVPALGYVVENAWLGSVLSGFVENHSNIQYLAPVKVESILPRRQGVELAMLSTAPNQSTNKLHCRLAVLADGAQSPLRQNLGIDVEVTDYQQTAIIANVAFEKPHAGVAYERFTDQGPLALLPLGESADSCRSALVWTHPNTNAAEIMALSDAEFLTQLQHRFGHRLGRFVKAGVRNSYPLRLIKAKEQVRSSLVLMGNAAHFLHPVAGQGFNLALRDCAALVSVLTDAQSDGLALGNLSVLNKYQNEQALDQELTIGFSDTVTRLFSTASLPLAVLRHLGFLGLELLPASKHFLAKQTMGRVGR